MKCVHTMCTLREAMIDSDAILFIAFVLIVSLVALAPAK